MNKEQKQQVDDWDPDDAKKLGSLKGIVEFKVEAEHDETKIEFSEPKKKKKINTTPSVIKLGKNKNKNSLF